MYVKNFVEIARSLQKANQTTSSFSWTPEAELAFETLRSRVVSISAFTSKQDPFLLQIGVIFTALGAALALVQNGWETDICYASKSFTGTETVYSAMKKLLTIVILTRVFCHGFHRSQSSTMFSYLGRSRKFDNPLVGKTSCTSLRRSTATRKINWAFRWPLPHFCCQISLSATQSKQKRAPLAQWRLFEKDWNWPNLQLTQDANTLFRHPSTISQSLMQNINKKLLMDFLHVDVTEFEYHKKKSLTWSLPLIT